ncbi:MAG: hypothetical protein ACTS6P_01935 [Candidatus Hodgkinia cicadicola]
MKKREVWSFWTYLMAWSLHPPGGRIALSALNKQLFRAKLDTSRA